MIVDAHMHVWEGLHPDRVHTWTPDPHPVEDLLPVLNANGVQRAVQVTPSLMAYDNEYGLAVAAAHPDRIRAAGRFDAGAEDAEGRLAAWLARPGAIGVA